MTDYDSYPPSEVSDQALLRAMAAGETQALDTLYTRYSAGIFGFLMARLGDRQVAEEVLQDVMLAAWNHAGQFRGESKVLTWLLTIARNRAINTRRKRRVIQVPIIDALDARSEDTGPFEKVLRHSEQRAVREALEQLPAPQREVLVLVFFHHLSAPEVAEVLDIAVGTVKSRLHRAKEALRRVLESEGRL